jgi:hypothetical protein
MDSSGRRNFDLIPRQFQIVRVGGASTTEPIEASHGIAQPHLAASKDILILEREVMLNPERRLLCELSCPIDCPPSEREALYTALTDSAATTDNLLLFANRLWPLARANFVAHVVSRRPANSALLYALLESHAAIEANEIYTKLKTARTADGIPAPSLANVNQGLNDLLRIHSGAVFVGYSRMEDALEPTLECALQVLDQGERRLVDALGSLLQAYSQYIAPLQKDATDLISNTCASLQEQHGDPVLIDRLADAVYAWMATARPLLLLSTYHGGRNLNFDTPVTELRKLIASLVAGRNYEVASKITDLTHDLFSAVPTTIDQLVEDAQLIETLSKYVGLSRLEKIISEFENDPSELTAALEQDGFGPASAEPATELWLAFVHAASNQQSEDAAWRLMQDFAIRLSNRPDAATAVVHLLTGLIEYGERVSAEPSFVSELRDNLSFMKSFIGIELVETNVTAAPTSKVKPPIRSFFWKRFRPSTNENDGGKRYRLVLTALAFLLVAAACASAAVEFDRLRLIWSTLSGQAPSLALGAETMPPIGSGQHLDLNGVRYCHFQQERLRYIKQKVQGPEDARAYNLLIVDYNSRCSDFFYQDNDLKTVLAEVDSKKRLLEADALRIMSSWTGHTAQKTSAESGR